MDKTKLKNFAIEARENLIKSVIVELKTIGIDEEGISGPSSNSTRDMYIFELDKDYSKKLEGKEIQKYDSLVREINKRKEETNYKSAYENLVEEVAYTWFNRLIAIRFMEVNNYIPNKLRVLSSNKEGVREPELVEFFHDSHLNLREEDLEELRRLKSDGSAASMDKIFKKLFIEECNYLNSYLPELFEKTDSYMDLLFNLSYNDPNSVVSKLVDLGEDIFNIEETGQIEIIGWMYQYYNEVPRDKVINIYKGNVAKEDIPYATQLFTTEWVVKYMVENSLGKYWIERNPDSKLKEKMEYLMPGDIEEVDEEISPEDLKIIDNAMGSGHILVYSFDILMEIYLERGYTPREAARIIIEKNIYGLDIDKRAYQLAYFALMMKARQYNRRILTQDISNNLRVIIDSPNINMEDLEMLNIKKEDNKYFEDIKYLLETFQNAREYGSILLIKEIDIDPIRSFLEDISLDDQLSIEHKTLVKFKKDFNQILDITEILNQKYDVVITNPPYLNKFSKDLKKYINNNYKDYKKDLFSVFIYNNINMCKSDGYAAYMTPFVWMFISSYEQLRKYIIENKHIDSLIQMEYSAFEEATVPICTFVLQNKKSNEEGQYIRLADFKGGMDIQKEKTLEAINQNDCDYYYINNQHNYKFIPGLPISYWASKKVYDIFYNNCNLDELSHVKVGLQTGKNDRFLRLWQEVEVNNCGLENFSREEAKRSNLKWFPYNKGGQFKKWFGNRDFLVNWEKDGKDIRAFERSVIRNIDFQFSESVSWSKISSGDIAFRYFPSGSLFDVAGTSIFIENSNLYYTIGILNSKIINYIIKFISPTLNYEVGHIKNLPIIFSEEYKPEVDKLVEENISLSKIDWDSFETSWDFDLHPLLDESKVGTCSSISSAYEAWKEYANNNFSKLKENEERLNEIFIDIYGLNDELDKYISDKDITIAKIFDKKSDIYEDIKGNQYILTREDVVKSFISYAVGNMFGRYSLDEKGLIFAGGEFDKKRYKKYKPVEDNVLVISEDEYLEDDIVNRFVDFVRVSFGEESLEDNLNFIASELKGRNMTAREKIRNYFLKDFYKDHVKTYKKTPIYWMYDSGKQNGFKALIYLHRYKEDTTGIVRTDHLHRLQRAYEAHIEAYSMNLDGQTGEEKKKLAKIKKQLNETRKYDEVLGHMALERISLDLDDGVKINHEKLQTDSEGKKHTILAKI